MSARRASEAQRRFEPLAGRLAALHPARLQEQARGRLARLTDRFLWALGGRASRGGERLADLAARLRALHPGRQALLHRRQVDALARQLEALSYRSALKRGYSVTRDEQGRLLRRVVDAETGQMLRTELADGTLHSRLTRKEETDGPAPCRSAVPDPPRRPNRSARQSDEPDSPTLFD
jgi:exodeoxyribonuclease VII large subunit